MLPAATAPLTTLLAPLQEDEEAAARRRRATREVAFQAAHRLRQELAHPAIVHFYAWLLQGYRTNSPFTNHALLGLFRRLADPQQLNLEPMLYQVGWGGVCMHGVSMHGGVVMLLPGFGAG
jgi:timeless